MVLPDGSRSLIPAAWTDLPPTSHTPSIAPADPFASLASLRQLLHARTIVDALLDRIGVSNDASQQKGCERETAELSGNVSAAKRQRCVGHSGRRAANPRPEHVGSADRKNGRRPNQRKRRRRPGGKP